MSKISTNYIMCQNVCSSCTTPMYINHVHQHHAMCQKISVIECINHMHLSIWQYVHLPICQPCASTNMPTMCIYQYAKQISSMSVPSCIITCTKKVYQPCINKLWLPNDVQRDYQLNSHLHVSICSLTTCKMNAPWYPTYASNNTS